MWKDLTMAQKSELMKIFIKSGITSTSEMASIYDKNHSTSYNSFATGGDKPPFNEWYNTVPSDRNDTTNYNLRKAYENIPFKQIERWKNATVEQLNNDDYHLPSVVKNSDGSYDFLKSKNHPSVKYEIDWYNSPEGASFKKDYQLDTTGTYYKYIPRNKNIFAPGGELGNDKDGDDVFKIKSNLGTSESTGIPYKPDNYAELPVTVVQDNAVDAIVNNIEPWISGLNLTAIGAPFVPHYAVKAVGKVATPILSSISTVIDTYQTARAIQNEEWGDAAWNAFEAALSLPIVRKSIKKGVTNNRVSPNEIAIKKKLDNITEAKKRAIEETGVSAADYVREKIINKNKNEAKSKKEQEAINKSTDIVYSTISAVPSAIDIGRAGVDTFFPTENNKYYTGGNMSDGGNLFYDEEKKDKWRQLDTERIYNRVPANENEYGGHLFKLKLKI
jgi:hypothetical protein